MIELLWAQDEYLAHEALERLERSMPAGVELVALEADPGGVPGLGEALSAPSLFATERLVVNAIQIAQIVEFVSHQQSKRRAIVGSSDLARRRDLHRLDEWNRWACDRCSRRQAAGPWVRQLPRVSADAERPQRHAAAKKAD